MKIKNLKLKTKYVVTNTLKASPLLVFAAPLTFASASGVANSTSSATVNLLTANYNVENLTVKQVGDYVSKQLNLQETKVTSNFTTKTGKADPAYLKQYINTYAHQKIYENILFSQAQVQRLTSDDLWAIRNGVLKALGILNTDNNALLKSDLSQNLYYKQIQERQLLKQMVNNHNTPFWKKQWFRRIKQILNMNAGELKNLIDGLPITSYNQGLLTTSYQTSVISNNNFWKSDTIDNYTFKRFILYFPLIFGSDNTQFYNFNWGEFLKEKEKENNIKNTKGSGSSNNAEATKKFKEALIEKFAELYGVSDMWRGHNGAIFHGFRPFNASSFTSFFQSIGNFFTDSFTNWSSVKISDDNVFNFISTYIYQNIDKLYKILTPENLKVAQEYALKNIDLSLPEIQIIASKYDINDSSKIKDIVFGNTETRNKNSSLIFTLLLANAYYKFGSYLESIGAYDYTGIVENVDINKRKSNKGSLNSLPQPQSIITSLVSSAINFISADHSQDLAYWQAYQILGDIMFMTKPEWDKKSANITWQPAPISFINEDVVNKKLQVKYAGTLLNWQNKTFNVSSIYNLLLRDQNTFSNSYVDLDSNWNIKYWSDIASIVASVPNLNLKRLPSDISTSYSGHSIIDFSVNDLKKWYDDISKKIQDPSNFVTKFNIDELHLTLDDFISLGLDKDPSFVLSKDEILNILKQLSLTIYDATSLDTIFKVNFPNQTNFTIADISNFITQLLKGNNYLTVEQGKDLMLPPLFEYLKNKIKKQLVGEINSKLLTKNSQSIYMINNQLHKQLLANEFASLLQMYVVYNAVNSKAALEKFAQIKDENQRKALIKAITGVVGVAVGIILTLIPTGVTQVAGGALIAASFGELLHAGITNVIKDIDTSKIQQALPKNPTEQDAKAYLSWILQKALYDSGKLDYVGVDKEASNLVAGVANVILNNNDLKVTFKTDTSASSSLADNQANQEITKRFLKNEKYDAALTSVLKTLANHRIQMSPQEWGRIEKLVDLQLKENNIINNYNFVRSIYQSSPSYTLKFDQSLNIKGKNVTFVKGSSAMLYLYEKYLNEGSNSNKSQSDIIDLVIKDIRQNHNNYTIANVSVVDDAYKKLMTFKLLSDLNLKPITIYNEDGTLNPQKSNDANIKQILIYYLEKLNPGIDITTYQAKSVDELVQVPVLQIDFFKTAMSKVVDPYKAMTIVNEGDALSLNSMLSNTLSDLTLGKFEKLVPSVIINKDLEIPSGFSWFTSAWKSIDTGDFYEKSFTQSSQQVIPIKLDVPINDVDNTSNNNTGIKSSYSQTITKEKSAYEIDFNFHNGANLVKTVDGVTVGQSKTSYYVATTSQTQNGAIITDWNTPREIDNLSDKKLDEVLLYTKITNSYLSFSDVKGSKRIIFNPAIINYTTSDGSLIAYDKLLPENKLDVTSIDVSQTKKNVTDYVIKTLAQINKHIDRLNILNLNDNQIIKFLETQFPGSSFINNQVVLKLSKDFSYLSRQYIILPIHHILNGFNYYDKIDYDASDDIYRFELANKEFTEINQLFAQIVNSAGQSLIQGVKYNNKPLKLVGTQWKDVSYVDALLVEPNSLISFQVASPSGTPIKVIVKIKDLISDYFLTKSDDINLQIPLNQRSTIYQMPYINSDLIKQNWNVDTLSQLSHEARETITKNEAIYFNTFENLFAYNVEHNVGNAKNYQDFPQLYNGIKENSQYLFSDTDDVKNGFLTEYLYTDKKLEKVIVLPGGINSLQAQTGDYTIEYLSGSQDENDKHITPQIEKFSLTSFDQTITFNKTGLYLLTLDDNKKVYIYIPEKYKTSTDKDINIYNYNLSDVITRENILQGYKYYKDDILYKKIFRYNQSLTSGKIDVKKQYVLDKLREINQVRSNSNLLYQQFYKLVDNYIRLQDEKRTLEHTQTTTYSLDKVTSAQKDLQNYTQKAKDVEKYLNFLLSNNRNTSSIETISLEELQTVIEKLNPILEQDNSNTIDKFNATELKSILESYLNKPTTSNQTDSSSTSNNDLMKQNWQYLKANILDKNYAKFKSLIDYKINTYTDDNAYNNVKDAYINSSFSKLLKSMLQDEQTNSSTTVSSRTNNHKLNSKYNKWEENIVAQFNNRFNNQFHIQKSNVKLVTFEELKKQLQDKDKDWKVNYETKGWNGKISLNNLHVAYNNNDLNSVFVFENSSSGSSSGKTTTTDKSGTLYIPIYDKKYVYENGSLIEDVNDNPDFWENIPNLKDTHNTKIQEWLKKAFSETKNNNAELNAREYWIKHYTEMEKLVDNYNTLISNVTQKQNDIQRVKYNKQSTYDVLKVNYDNLTIQIGNIDRQLNSLYKQISQRVPLVINLLHTFYGKKNLSIYVKGTSQLDKNVYGLNLVPFDTIVDKLTYKVDLTKYNADYLADYINNHTQYNTLKDLTDDLGLNISNFDIQNNTTPIKYNASAVQNSINIVINNYNLKLNLDLGTGSFNVNGFANDNLNDTHILTIGNGWLKYKLDDKILKVNEDDVYKDNTNSLNLTATEVYNITGIIITNNLPSSISDRYDIIYGTDKNDIKGKSLTIVLHTNSTNQIGQGENSPIPQFTIYQDRDETGKLLYDEDGSPIYTGKWNSTYDLSIKNKNWIQFSHLNLTPIYRLKTVNLISKANNFYDLVVNGKQIEKDLFEQLGINADLTTVYNGKTIIDKSRFSYTFDTVYYSADKVYFNVIVRYKNLNHTYRFVMNNFLDNYVPVVFKKTPTEFDNLDKFIQFNDYDKYKMVDNTQARDGINKDLIEAVIGNILTNNQYIARSISEDGTPLISSTGNLKNDLNESIANMINAIFATDNTSYYASAFKDKSFKAMYDGLIQLIHIVPTEQELKWIKMSDSDINAISDEDTRAQIRQTKSYFQINPLYQLETFNKPLFTGQQIYISFVDKTKLDYSNSQNEQLTKLDQIKSPYNKYDNKVRYIVWDNEKQEFTTTETKSPLDLLLIKSHPTILANLNNVLKRINTYATFSYQGGQNTNAKYDNVTFNIELNNNISKIKYGLTTKSLLSNQILETWTNYYKDNNTTPVRFVRDIQGVHILPDANNENFKLLPIRSEYGTLSDVNTTTLSVKDIDTGLNQQLNQIASFEYAQLTKANPNLIQGNKNKTLTNALVSVGVIILTGGLAYVIWRIVSKRKNNVK